MLLRSVTSVQAESFFFVLFSVVCLSVIHNKDLLATIHLLVAMAKAFQPELNLPPNVKIDVVIVEVSLFSPRPAWWNSHTALANFSFSPRWARAESDLRCRPKSWQRTGEWISASCLCLTLISLKKKKNRSHITFIFLVCSNAGSDSSGYPESEWEWSEVELMWHLECHPNAIKAY